jgi:sugar phosphate permease
MSLAFVGTGVGGAVMAPAANWVIHSYGWRTAFGLCGILCVFVAFPVILLVIRDRPSDVGLEPYTTGASSTEATGDAWGVSAKEAFSTRAFWLIAAAMFIVALVANGIHNHCPAYLEDIGHSPDRAAFAWGAAMTVMILGKLTFGPIADRWGPKTAMAGVFIFFTLSIIALTLARPYWVALVFSGLYGFAAGGPLTIYPLLVVGSLGIKNFGAIYGNLVIAAALGSAIGPFAPGLVFTRVGTYIPIFIVFMALTILGFVCALFIRPANTRMRKENM